MAQFENIAPTTELAAVNEMLGVIGEAAIDQAELDNPSLPDVSLAVRLLRGTMRAELSEGWRFNVEYGYELAPAGTVEWTDTEGETTTLNVWTPPSDLLLWELTDTSEHLSGGLHSRPLDLIIRKSRKYQEEGSFVKVFYDREQNRDGLDSSKFDHLYIDPTWMVDFEDCPQTFRSYVTVVAARRLLVQQVGSTELYQLTQRDEAKALRALRKDQGQKEKINMFDNAESAAFLGRHRRHRGGRFIDRRDSPGLS